MKKLIISPCGTSILTNNIPNELRKKLTQITNVRNASDIETETKTELEAYFKHRKEEIVSIGEHSMVKKASAELNGILTYLDKNGTDSQDSIILLRTDTWLGEITSDIVSTWLKKNHFQVDIHKITDLQTKEILSFKLALSDLYAWVEEVATGYRNSGYHIVFNLTGGFKSVNGFLQTIGSIYADEVVYIFESSSELLSIPGLPFSLNYEPLFEEKVNIIRKINLELPVSTQEVQGLDLFLFELDNKYVLNDIGLTVWSQLKKKIYAKALLPSLSDRLLIRKSFTDSIESLPSDRLSILNEQLDLAHIYVESGKNLRSFRFHSLTGNAFPGSTHEFYAWSDKDAKRVYCHFEGDILVLDQLSKHL